MFGPAALVAQVSYGENESESNNWIVDNCSTHHINGHHNEFINTTGEGYVDAVLLKGLTSNTKDYGIGTCIICLKDENGAFIKNVVRMYSMYRLYFTTT